MAFRLERIWNTLMRLLYRVPLKEGGSIKDRDKILKNLTLPKEKSKKPLVILFMGRVASGKSYLAKKIIKVLPLFAYLRADKIRPQLVREPTFSDEEHELVFGAIDQAIKQLVKKGYNTIYDANLKKREYRRRLEKMIKKDGGKVLVIYTKCSSKRALNRIRYRNWQIRKGKKRGFIIPMVYYQFHYFGPSEFEPPLKSEEAIIYNSQYNGRRFGKVIAKIEKLLERG